MNVNSNKLTLNKQESAIFSMINNAKIAGKRVIAWRLIGSKKICVDVRFRILRKFRSELVVRSLSEKGQAQLASMSLTNEDIYFYVPDDMMLFKSQIKAKMFEGDLTVSFPKEMGLIDRRKHLRLVVEERNVLIRFSKLIKHNQNREVNFDKKLFDLSAGGCSFVVSSMESTYFREQDNLYAIELIVNGRVHVVNAQIVNIFWVKPDKQNNLYYQGQKICVKFTGISDQSRREIDDYVFSQVNLGENVFNF